MPNPPGSVIVALFPAVKTVRQAPCKWNSISISAARTPICRTGSSPAIEARTGARFRYVPVLLGGVFKATGNRSPAEAFAGIRNKPDV